ncbi:MAG: asparagine synthase (glutamine-hydrolyzing) [bacterium]
MCGICGIFSPNNVIVEENIIRSMMGILRHRGPDGEGIFIDQGIAFGHRRLSVIDLDTGNQPMSNEDNSIWVVYNGEIYNFLELRKWLEKKHKFKTKSDTEVLLHLYEEFGVEFVKKLRGMFAFALWDRRKKVIMLARDRLGKKPLYYSIKNGSLIFASEIKSVTEYPGIDRDIDFESIDDYLSYQYIPGPKTVYKSIKSVRPAHFVLYDMKGKMKSERYWSLDFKKKLNCSSEDYKKLLVDKLTESVRLRLVSDVPLGAFLSGGIDSSIIVGLMSKISSGRVKTFSIGFEGMKFSELPFAKRISEHFDTDHHEATVKPFSIGVLPKVLSYYDQPFADSSALPSYFVAQQTQKHVKVVLNGDGGDENFAGYLRYRALKISELLLKFISPNQIGSGTLLNNRLKSLLKHLCPKNSAKSKYLQRFMDGLYSSPAKRNASWHTRFDSKYKGYLYSKEMRNTVYIKDVLYLEDVFNNAAADTNVDKALFTDMLIYLPENLLVKMDIACMANSLEGRSPFLDHEFVELAAAIPDKMKLNYCNSKIILKNAFKYILPSKILNRKKAGFGIPVDEWFRGDLTGYIREILLSQKALQRGYFEKKYVIKLIEDHQNKISDHGNQLWTLLCLELWHNIFVDNRQDRVIN